MCDVVWCKGWCVLYTADASAEERGVAMRGDAVIAEKKQIGERGQEM